MGDRRGKEKDPRIGHSRNDPPRWLLREGGLEAAKKRRRNANLVVAEALVEAAGEAEAEALAETLLAEMTRMMTSSTTAKVSLPKRKIRRKQTPNPTPRPTESGRFPLHPKKKRKRARLPTAIKKTRPSNQPKRSPRSLSPDPPPPLPTPRLRPLWLINLPRKFP